MEIKVYDKSFYMGFAEHENNGQRALTHAAWIRDDRGGKFRAYLKLYTKKNKELINEITGYLIASALELPQTDKAFFIHVPIEELRKIYTGIDFGDHDKDTIPLWGTREIPGETPKIRFSGVASRILKRDLKKWNKLVDVIAFDEWTANTDRNTGNLVRQRTGKYYIIDHGALATGPDWTIRTLAPGKLYINKLISIVWGDDVGLRQVNSMIDACKKHKSAYALAKDKLWLWWEEALSGEEVRSLDVFLNERADQDTIKKLHGVI